MQRVLGIDFGSRRMGLALSDPMQIIASPFKTVLISSIADAVSTVKSLSEENAVGTIVLGLPLGMKGQETQQTEQVRKFGQLLENEGLIVVMEDERLSSVAAKRALVQQGVNTGREKGRVDETAAALLLQGFLDRSK